MSKHADCLQARSVVLDDAARPAAELSAAAKRRAASAAPSLEGSSASPLAAAPSPSASSLPDASICRKTGARANAGERVRWAGLPRRERRPMGALGAACAPAAAGAHAVASAAGAAAGVHSVASAAGAARAAGQQVRPWLREQLRCFVALHSPPHHMPRASRQLAAHLIHHSVRWHQDGRRRRCSAVFSLHPMPQV